MQKRGKICVIGLGYIGLPTATMFAVNGFEVVGVDVQEKVVAIINNGGIHIEEPGLAEMVQGAVMEQNLKASTTPEEADTFIIAVPTPLTEVKGADLSYVEAAARNILPYLKKGDLVIVESTISPRTTTDVVAPILNKGNLELGEELYLAHCPERVLPGKIINELTNNNRIIGGINEKSALKARKLYSSFVQGEMYLTDATTAEMVKLMENTYRDVNIALANELALIAEEIEIDVWEAVELANKHPRVNVHLPGPGVGGHCLAVDPWFIVESSPELAKLITLSRNINDSMPEYVVEKVKSLTRNIEEPKIAICGITYKGNVDDLRESPILDVIDNLFKDGFKLSIHDPHVEDSIYNLVDLESALAEADLILLGADHNEFKDIDPELAAELMNTKKVFDTKNIIDHDLWQEKGFKTYKIGDFSNNDWQKKYGINEFNLQDESGVAEA